MLDQDMKEQLKNVFAQLENKIELVYKKSSHADQASLLEMLNDLASTSDKINIKADNENESLRPPEFHIVYNGKANGISFKGIPGGHEFTSLVVALLNSDGKGKMPDPILAQRIKKLKGPIQITTYISLTCENCPDVVQALNQMAILHGNFNHQMTDGAYVQDEIQSLGIQGVPSVVVNKKMIHSGRIQLLDLVQKLEEIFGIDTSQASEPITPTNLGDFDVVVVGGGPAGAAAAIYSVRKGLKTALIADRFGGQVQDTNGIENLISVVHTEGPQLAAQLNKHVTSYPVHVFENRRVKNIEKDSKVLHLEGGEFLQAKSIIIATGAKWRELGVSGEKEYMGRGVAYCPHCDGPFYKGKKVAVIGGGNSGVEAAIDLAGIVREVVLFEFNHELKADQVLIDKLKSLPNTSIVSSAKTKSIQGDSQKVHSLVYEDRKTEKEVTVELDGIFVQIGLLPNSQFVKDTLNTTKFGEIIIDEKCRTSVPGIYAAGDVTTTPYKQIIIAMGEGAKAALAAFEDRMYHGS